MWKVLAATALAVTLFGCGDDDGGGAADDPSTVTTGGAAITPDTATDAAEGTTGTFTGEDSEALCAFAAEVGDVDTDDFDRVAELYEGAIEQAPDEIRGAFERLRDALRDYVAVLDELGVEGNDISTVTDPAQMERLAEVFDDPSVAEASEQVTVYLTEVCGLE